MAQGAGVRSAGRYLHDLLLRPGPYRRRWAERAVRPGGDEINQRAVCRVLAWYLWNDGREVDENSLKDRVARALRGEVLSAETLQLFIDAFDVEESDATELWSRLFDTPTEQVRVIAGSLEVPSTWPFAREANQFRTVSIHEIHRLGADGLPAEHNTSQVIEAVADGVTSYPYRFDTDAATVVAVRGGTPGPLYRFDELFHAVDIKFSRPLRKGETASFEYRTIFRYAEAPPLEFRRIAYRRLESLQIRVEFHPDRLPSSVWWTTWDAVEGSPVRQQEVFLDEDRSVHRYLTVLERAIVGFTWDW